MAIKPEAGANASAKRVRRAIKEYMQKQTMVCGQAVVFSASSPSRLSGASHSLRACLKLKLFPVAFCYY